MTTFAYKARDEAGKAVTGTMDAVSEEALLKKLRKLSYMPVSIEESIRKVKMESTKIDLFSRKIKAEDLAMFNMQLASMIDAGITLLSALNIISKQIVNESFRGVIEKVKEAVSGGSSLSEALSMHPQVFSGIVHGLRRVSAVDYHELRYFGGMPAYRYERL